MAKSRKHTPKSATGTTEKEVSIVDAIHTEEEKLQEAIRSMVVYENQLREAVANFSETQSQLFEQESGRPLTPEEEEKVSQIVSTIFEKGLSLQNILKLTNEDMETIYSIAYSLYNGGQYAKAHAFFQLLTLCDQLTSKYWIGLGACRQMMGQYQDAIYAYGFATLTDPTFPPEPNFHAGECAMALNNLEDARKAFEGVVTLSGSQKQFAQLVARAKAMLSTIEKKMAQSPKKK